MKSEQILAATILVGVYGSLLRLLIGLVQELRRRKQVRRTAGRT